LLALLWAHVRAAAVEVLVAREEVRAFALKPSEEDVFDLGAKVEGYAAEEGRVGFAGSIDYRLDLLGRIVDAGHQGSYEDARVDAAPAKFDYCVETR
jgi:hypothetical protein